MQEKLTKFGSFFSLRKTKATKQFDVAFLFINDYFFQNDRVAKHLK